MRKEEEENEGGRETKGVRERETGRQRGKDGKSSKTGWRFYNSVFFYFRLRNVKDK